MIAKILVAAALAAAAAQTANWPLHNLDLAGRRFSPLDQITPANVRALAPRWLFQTGVIDGVSNQTTPVVVDGVIYATDPRGSVYALDAAEGQLKWIFDVTDRIGGGAKAGYIFRNRGVCYADGVVYTAAGSFLFAIDARTGKPIKGFGTDGQARVILDVIKQRYPEVDVGDRARLLVHHRAAGVRRRDLYRQHAQRKPHSRRTCDCRRREDGERCCGTSTPSRRTTRIRAGRSPARRGLAASATAAASGKRRRSIPTSACCMSQSATRSATARSGSARTCSPIRSSR